MTAAQVKERLCADLKTAMLGKDRARAALIRTLIAAIDNAEAVEASAEQQTESFRKLGDPSGEVARRELSEVDIAAVLEAEVASRIEAEAARLEREAHMVRGYMQM
jgi:uncharacterized protein